MTTQLLKEKEASELFYNIPSFAWHTLANTYVCRTSLREENDGRVLATAIRRPDIAVAGSTKDEAMQLLQQAYKQAVLSSKPMLKPIKDVANAELWQAVNCMIEVDDAEMRKAIADRAPSCDDLDLIAIDTPREWLDEPSWQ